MSRSDGPDDREAEGAPEWLGSKARFSHTAALGVRENVSSHGLEN